MRRERQRWRPLRAETRSELGLQCGTFVALSVARMTARKRPEDLLRALALNDDGAGESVALFVGDGPLRPCLEALARELGVRAIFVGFANQSQIGKYLSIADTFIVSSEQDNSPKSINEAMNFGLPIICTDVVGTARDLVHEGQNGLLFGVGDIEHLSRCIERLRDDSSLRWSMGTQSLRRVKQWSFDHNVDSIRRELRLLRN
ncbi:glycosyltransferase family 4 protein [Planctomycetota bacterium]|nr:glycosyltransferase family 4 protein [Planctomycetota bacterium]